MESHRFLPGTLLVAITGCLLLAACHKDPPADITPFIGSFTPASGTEGATVVITGSNFNKTAAANTVQFNGTAAEVTAATANELTVTVPVGATSGKITITVNDKIAASATVFTVDPSAPLINSFTPDTGITGTVVTITGTHFTSSSEVWFGAVKATEVIFNSATQLTAHVPVNALTAKIKVKAGTLEVISATDFTVLPVANTFSPTHGEAGSVITLTGDGFAANAEVLINDVLVTAGNYTIREAGKIECKIPATATSGKVRLRQGGQEYDFTGKYTVTNIWEQRNTGFAASAQYNNGITFVYHNKIYKGLGRDGSNVAATKFRIYDPVANTWSDGPDFPAAVVGKADARAAVLNDKVYIGSGFGQKDWWEFDPSQTGNAAWRQLTNFPVAGYGSVSFVAGGKLYAGQGTGGANFYEFDPAGSNGMGDWLPKIILNVSRDYALAFVINDEVYWGGGTSNTQVLTSFQKYTINASGYTGTAIAAAPAGNIYQGNAFADGGKGYVCTSWGKFLEYAPAADSWTNKASIPDPNFTYHADVADGHIFATATNGKTYVYVPNY